MFVNLLVAYPSILFILILSNRLSFATEDSVVSSFISLFFVILWVLIIASLIGTFSIRLAVIHKVLSLLFLSVFTVFLWLIITQFLFIYLVYILAFVGAVLILFLSVVLMLPISIISSTEQNRLNVCLIFFLNINNIKIRPDLQIGNRVKGFDYWLLHFSQTNWLLVVVSLVSFYYLFRMLVEVVINQDYRHQFESWKLNCVKPLASDIMEFFRQPKNKKNARTGWWRYSTSVHASNLLTWTTEPFPFTFVWFWRPKNKLFVKVYSKIFSDRKKTLQIGGTPVHYCGDPFVFTPEKRVLIDSHLHMYHNIISFICICYLLVKRAFNFPFGRLVNKVTWNIYIVVNNKFFELVAQLFVIFSFILLVIPAGLTAFFSSTKTIIFGSESTGGLVSLKEVLYEQTGLFILLTAIVLLVSLIGAAVIVRNKK